MSVSKDLNPIVYDYNVPYGSIAVITFVYVKLIITQIYSLYVYLSLAGVSLVRRSIFLLRILKYIFDQAASLTLYNYIHISISHNFS